MQMSLGEFELQQLIMLHAIGNHLLTMLHASDNHLLFYCILPYFVKLGAGYRTVPLLLPFLVTKLADACRSSLAMTHAVAGDGLGNSDELHGAPPPRRHCAAADGPPESVETTETWTDACFVSMLDLFNTMCCAEKSHAHVTWSCSLATRLLWNADDKEFGFPQVCTLRSVLAVPQMILMQLNMTLSHEATFAKATWRQAAPYLLNRLADGYRSSDLDGVSRLLGNMLRPRLRAENGACKPTDAEVLLRTQGKCNQVAVRSVVPNYS